MRANIFACGRTSAQNATPALKVSWDKRMKQRAERAAVMAMQRAADETIREEKRAEREARLAKEEKKKADIERGQPYQIITNTAKIKKMSKKQLRTIKKADTSGVKPKVYKS